MYNGGASDGGAYREYFRNRKHKTLSSYLDVDNLEKFQDLYRQIFADSQSDADLLDLRDLPFMCLAAEAGATQCAEFLMSQGKVYSENFAVNKQLQCVLVHSGYKSYKNHKDDYNKAQTAIEVSIEQDKTDTFRLLFQSIPRITKYHELAGRIDYLERLETFAKSGSEIAQALEAERGKWEFYSLLYSTIEHNPEKIDEILALDGQRAYDLNLSFEDLGTPLCFAIEHDSKAFRQLLEHERVNPNHQDAQGRFALISAYNWGTNNKGNYSNLGALIKKGVNCDLVNGDGKTVLIKAITDRKYGVAETLIKKIGQNNNSTYSIDKKDQQGNTALIYATCAIDDESLVMQLLVAGADPSGTNDNGWNALHTAAFHGNNHAIGILLDKERGLINMTTDSGSTPLMLLCQARQSQIHEDQEVEFDLKNCLLSLLRRGADPTIVCKGATVLEKFEKLRKSYLEEYEILQKAMQGKDWLGQDLRFEWARRVRGSRAGAVSAVAVTTTTTTTATKVASSSAARGGDDDDDDAIGADGASVERLVPVVVDDGERGDDDAAATTTTTTTVGDNTSTAANDVAASPVDWEQIDMSDSVEDGGHTVPNSPSHSIGDGESRSTTPDSTAAAIPSSVAGAIGGAARVVDPNATTSLQSSADTDAKVEAPPPARLTKPRRGGGANARKGRGRGRFS